MVLNIRDFESQMKGLLWVKYD